MDDIREILARLENQLADRLDGLERRIEGLADQMSEGFRALAANQEEMLNVMNDFVRKYEKTG